MSNLQGINKHKQQNDTDSQNQDCQGKDNQLYNRSHPKFSSLTFIHQYVTFLINTLNSTNSSFQPISNIFCLQNIKTLRKSIHQLTKHQQTSKNNRQNHNPQILKNIFSIQSIISTQLYQDILKSNKFTKTNTFTTSLIIDEIHPSKHFQVVDIQIQLLDLKTVISILNLPETNPFASTIQPYARGNFGSVYLLSILNQNMALKSIPFVRPQIQTLFSKIKFYSSSFIQILQEYFFLLLFSQLHIGPNVKKIAGFDIISYQNQLIFATEICQEQFQNSQKINYQQLNDDLLKMHALQVVHRDIKPKNIMYSPTYKKIIFIDFGCSEVLSEKIGQRTLTTFKGTTGYANEELLDIAIKANGFVDLYYSDFFALQKSKQELQVLKVQTQQTNESTKSKVNVIKTPNFDLIAIKSHLLSQNLQKAQLKLQQLQRTHPSCFQEVQTELMRFLPQLPITEAIKNFYLGQFDQDIRNLQQFVPIADLFQKENLQLAHIYVDYPESEDRFSRISYLYKALSIEKGHYTTNEKQILLILETQYQVKNFINSFKYNANKQQLQSQRPLHEAKNNIPKQILMLCILIANYCSLSKNKQRVDIEEKARMCHLGLKILDQAEIIQFDQYPFIFENFADQQLNVISKFYQIYAFEITKEIPFNLKVREIVNCISTLGILGYPLQQNSQYHYLVKELIKQPEHQYDKKGLKITEGDAFENVQILEIIDSMRLIRQCNPKITIFFNRNSIKINKNFLQSDEKLSFQDVISERIESLAFRDEIKDLIWTIDIDNFDLEQFLASANTLLSPSILQLCDKNQSLMKIWLFYCVSLSLAANGYRLESTHILLNHIKPLLKSFVWKQNQLVYYIIYDKLYGRRQSNGSPQIFLKAESIINYPKISIRSKFHCQLLIAMMKKDSQTVQRIKAMLQQELSNKQISKKQLETMSLINGQIWNHLSDVYIASKTNATFEMFQILQNFYPLVVVLLDFGFRYGTQLTNTNCLYEIRIDKPSYHSIFSVIQQMQNVRVFYIHLIKIIQLFSEIYPSQDCQFQKTQLDRKNSHSLQPKQIRPLFKPEHIQFLTNLPNKSIIYHQIHTLLQPISQNKSVKSLIHKSKLLQHLILQQSQHVSKQKNIDHTLEFICDLNPTDLDNFSILCGKVPNFLYAFEYMNCKLQKSNFKIFYCDKMIELYHYGVHNNFFTSFHMRSIFFGSLFTSFIVTNKPFRLIIEYIREMAANIQTITVKKQIFNFLNLLNLFFWSRLEMLYCCPSPILWNKQQFFNVLGQSLQQYSPQSHPYMSIAFYECLSFDRMIFPYFKKMVIFILKSMPYLKDYAVKLLLPKMYFCVYVAFQLDKRNFFLFQRLLAQNYSLQPLFNKSEVNLRVHRRFFYAYVKYQKNKDDMQISVQEFIDTMLIKEKYFKNYRLPEIARKGYIKKLQKCAKVKGIQHSKI